MKKLITSALPYVHGVPHLGNIIGSVLPADVYARFCRLRGEEVLFICGSDSHGTMFEIAAERRNTTPKKLAYENHKKVMEIFEKFKLSFDYYGITDSETNREFTYHIFRKLDENGYIKEKEVESAYCERCNRFLPDRFIEGKCPFCGGLTRGDQCDDCGKLMNIKEIIEPHCVLCNGEVTFKKTRHLFLDLPKFEKELFDFVKNSRGWSKLAKKETLGFLKQGLKPRAITRDASWGFKVPKKNYENKVFYVWFDAPIGYLSFTKEWCLKNDQKFEEWWKNEKTKLVQFMGKDNTIFHSIIFPAMLLGCRENWKLADRLISSGWLKTEGIKFSKSRGKGLTTEEALKKYPADYWRFVLVSLYPEQNDSVFSIKILKERWQKLNYLCYNITMAEAKQQPNNTAKPPIKKPRPAPAAPKKSPAPSPGPRSRATPSGGGGMSRRGFLKARAMAAPMTPTTAVDGRNVSGSAATRLGETRPPVARPSDGSAVGAR